MAELKPCPFCGSNNIVKGETKELGKGLVGFVACPECSARIERSVKRKAVEAWNRRAGNGC